MAPAQSKPTSSCTAKGNSSKRKGKARAEPEESLSGAEAMTTSLKKRGGRQHGASGYQDDELLTLIELVRQILPQGTKGWERVANEHNEVWSDPKRTVNSLKQRWDRVSCSGLCFG
jgi:hypothetical protein